jgi:hypothetical protein
MEGGTHGVDGAVLREERRQLVHIGIKRKRACKQRARIRRSRRRTPVLQCLRPPYCPLTTCFAVDSIPHSTELPLSSVKALSRCLIR